MYNIDFVHVQHFKCRKPKANLMAWIQSDTTSICAAHTHTANFYLEFESMHSVCTVIRPHSRFDDTVYNAKL